MIKSTLLTILSLSFLSANENIEGFLKENSKNIANGPFSTYLPRGTILMVGSNEVDNWFNMVGAGVGEYQGWYICDGRNGTPDLRGRFVVGRDSLNINSDYGNLGATGGLAHIHISEENLPPHTHQINLQTSFNGAHSHPYQDVTYADGCDFLVPTYRGIASGRANNRACEISRITTPSGEHSHTLNGKSDPGNGKNIAIENRPPYYVVVYIIYKGPN